MPRSFSTAGWKEPRILLRIIMGVLLVANLAAAIVAFKPFGGSAEDLRRDAAVLSQQLTSARAAVVKDKVMTVKMQNARKDIDQFLKKYVTDERVSASTLYAELDRIATEAGVRQLPGGYNPQPIEGSNGMNMVSITNGFEGTYPSLAKFINLVDKSPRFLIIENLSTNAPMQNGAPLNVQIKIDTFTNGAGDLP